MANKIQNIEELRFELKRLKKIKVQKEAELNKDIKEFQTKFSVLGKLLSFMSPFGNKAKDSVLFQNTGITGLGMLLVDKLLLNNSGPVVKVISELLYTKLASSVTKEDIFSWFDKLKGWFKKTDKKEDQSNRTEDKNNPSASDQQE